MLLLWIGLLGVTWVQGAQVYMEFNGHRYSYNTDGDRLDRSVHPPNYSFGWDSPSSLQFVQQALHSRQPPLPSLATSSLSGGYLAAPPPADHRNFDFSTHQMAHAQHTDAAGNVLGKYSYYDEAGYHELSYKAGAGIGFVVMGGNLAKATSAASEPHSEVASQADALTDFQELHKYRGYP